MGGLENFLKITYFDVVCMETLSIYHIIVYKETPWGIFNVLFL